MIDCSQGESTRLSRRNICPSIKALKTWSKFSSAMQGEIKKALSRLPQEPGKGAIQVPNPGQDLCYPCVALDQRVAILYRYEAKWKILHRRYILIDFRLDQDCPY